MKRGILLVTLYLSLLSVLPLSSAFINFLSPPFNTGQPGMYTNPLLLQQLALARVLLPLLSGTLGLVSLSAFTIFKRSAVLPSAHIVLFVSSRFASFLASSQPGHVLLLLVALLFPDTTFYHSLAYLACALASLPVLVYLNESLERK